MQSPLSSDRIDHFRNQSWYRNHESVSLSTKRNRVCLKICQTEKPRFGFFRLVHQERDRSRSDSTEETSMRIFSRKLQGSLSKDTAKSTQGLVNRPASIRDTRSRKKPRFEFLRLVHQRKDRTSMRIFSQKLKEKKNLFKDKIERSLDSYSFAWSNVEEIDLE